MRTLFPILFSIVCGMLCRAQNSNVVLRSHMTFNQTLANICGYAADGREYALLGAAQGMIVVDVTDPDTPVQIVQIPMVDNLWKEIKVYQHYAYVTTEGYGGALQIIDLTNLPAPNLSYHTYNGDGVINQQLQTIHALHIDETKGYCYLYGANIAGGGVVVLDLNQDPYNPQYVGQYNQNYVHDGYVDNDTLFAAEIYKGRMRVFDFTNKTAPVVLADQPTPTNFTHNTWLTPDKSHVLTTDENNFSYLTCYRITDLDDIVETDRIQATPGSGSVVHNTHITQDYYAVTSWYKDGFTIVDCSRPHNLIQVGRYDTYPDGEGGGFDGAWGVYPFLPSGTIVVSNIDEGLFVLTPTYKRGCYFEGFVRDSLTNDPLFGATVKILSGDPQAITQSLTNGAFACGQQQSGTFEVEVSKPGYLTRTLTIELNNGQLTELTIRLLPDITYSISGTTQPQGIGGLDVRLYNDLIPGQTQTDPAGQYAFYNLISGNYDLYFAKWGYYPQKVSVELQNDIVVNPVLAQSDTLIVYGDWFETDLGWTVSGNASTGHWVRGKPIGTTLNGQFANPPTDSPHDPFNDCYVTGNAEGAAGLADVDDGYTILKSPFFAHYPNVDTANSISTYPNFEYIFKISFDYWFFNGGGTSTPNDTLSVYLQYPVNVGLIKIKQITTNTNGWQSIDTLIVVSQVLTDYFIYSGDTVYLCSESGILIPFYLIFVAEDAAPGHLVEAAVDNIKIKYYISPECTVGTHDMDSDWRLRAYPNPFQEVCRIEFDTPAPGRWFISDVLGKVVDSGSALVGKNSFEWSCDCPAGVYFLHTPVGATALVRN